MPFDLATAFDGMEGLDLENPVFHPVAGRVLHIDADFLAYMCSAQSKDPADQKTFAEMQDNARTRVDLMIDTARASDVFMHMTSRESNKGGRYAIAIQKQYQSSRDDKPKPLYLNEMRKWLATEYPGAVYEDYEADDGMAAAQYKQVLQDKRDLAVICSKDKDLLMIPGLHMDWDTGELTDFDEVGHLELRKTASGSTSLKGTGFAFFAGQMLTGDAADTITGLPCLDHTVANKYVPKQNGKHDKPCRIGPVAALGVLDGCKTVKEYWMRVAECYKAWGNRFTYYKTGEAMSWQPVLMSEAQMLWIRRYDPADATDFLKYMKETCK